MNCDMKNISTYVSWEVWQMMRPAFRAVSDKYGNQFRQSICRGFDKGRNPSFLAQRIQQRMLKDPQGTQYED